MRKDETFFTDKEYPTFFVDLEGIPEKVASELGDLQGDLFDKCTGSAYYAMTLARKQPA